MSLILSFSSFLSPSIIFILICIITQDIKLFRKSEILFAVASHDKIHVLNDIFW